MSYSIILLDWDGCLANTLPLWMQACQETFVELGVEGLSRREIVDNVFGRVQGPAIFGVDAYDYWSKATEKIDAAYADVELHDGIIEVLERLSAQGKQMAIVSSSKREMLDAAIKKQGVEPFIQFYLGAEDVSKQKPNPQAVEIALERLGGEKEETVLVGDSEHDLGMGANAGITTVLHYPLVNEDFYELDELKTYNPNFVIRSFAELEQIVD